MKKLLLTTAIVGAVAFTAAPAKADIQLGLGGHFKGYLSWVDQDEATGAGTGVRSFDMVRDTEIHFTGETTLDNGLTVGFHAEELADGGEFATQESYAYFAGNWGRVNFGAEDGAAYLLQVAAPSADSNFDGIRQYVNGVNYAVGAAPAATSAVLSPAAGGYAAAVGLAGRVFDYDNVAAGGNNYSDKITYITPVFSGFQAAASYTPDQGYAGSFGNRTNNVVGAFGNSYEGAVRYEGQFNAARITLGGGYVETNLEATANPIVANSITDDVKSWNLGANVGFGPFNLGAAYLKSNNGDVASAVTTNRNSDSTTWVAGADYTTGPFVLGASYYNQHQERGSVADFDTERYAGGVTYTYGPGMSFRGSVAHVENDDKTAGVADFDATTVLLGTQINF